VAAADLIEMTKFAPANDQINLYFQLVAKGLVVCDYALKLYVFNR
jgi:hypothetical protein